MDLVQCRWVEEDVTRTIRIGDNENRFEEDLPDVGMKMIVQVLNMDWMKAYELSRFSHRYS